MKNTNKPALTHSSSLLLPQMLRGGTVAADVERTPHAPRPPDEISAALRPPPDSDESCHLNREIQVYMYML